MGMLYGGIAAVVLAIILFLVKLSKKKALFSVLSAEKKNCKDLQDISKQVADEIGSGSFSERCKIYGKVESANPLSSELAGKPCVYYSSSIYRKYEDYEISTDADGNETERLVTKEELLSSNVNKIPFYINDGTGKVKVDLEGASLDTVKVLDKFVPGEGGSSLSLGSFSFNIGSMDFGRSNTLGYRYVDEIIPIDRNLLVVGRANDANGELTFNSPEDKDYKYIISLKSEQQYVSGSKKSINILNIVSIVSLVGGAVLTALQFILKK